MMDNTKSQTVYTYLSHQMYGMYHTFNFLTGYTQTNPSVQSIEWRLIVLESVAGVPGFVAAGKCENLSHHIEESS